MVGRAVDLTVDKAPATPGAPALVVSGLTVIDPRGQVLVNNVSFTVAAGEILAIAGVQGNGQTELTEALMGLQPRVVGDITLDGKTLRGYSVRQVLDAGVGFVPEDRTEDGLVGGFTIAENLMLDRSHTLPFVKRFNLQLALLAEFATAKVKEFDVRSQGIDTPVGRLSGGNQQKVVLARELSRELRLFIAAQPTRGLDVGSIEFVHERIVATRDAGTAVIVISTELDEVAALADRIMVMYRGRIIGIVPGDTPRAVLGLMMAGEPAPTAPVLTPPAPTEGAAA
jgi:simple sugar transport system ATP-binding protein